jgi:hypothetical protein
MEISHELILGPEDIDQLSIKCKSCKTVVVVSLSALTLSGDKAAKKAGQVDMPTKCPSCDQDWTKVYGVVRDFREGLEGLKEHDVSFRIPEPEQYMVRSAHRSRRPASLCHSEEPDGRRR